MSADTSMTGRDVYLRHTDTGGASFVQQHRVWDTGRFLAARADDAQKANAKQPDGAPRLAKVELLTRDEYLAARSRRPS